MIHIKLFAGNFYADKETICRDEFEFSTPECISLLSCNSNIYRWSFVKMGTMKQSTNSLGMCSQKIPFSVEPVIRFLLWSRWTIFLLKTASRKIARNDSSLLPASHDLISDHVKFSIHPPCLVFVSDSTDCFLSNLFFVQLLGCLVICLQRTAIFVIGKDTMVTGLWQLCRLFIQTVRVS